MQEVKVLKQLPWLVLLLLWAAGITLWLLFVAEQQSHLKIAFQNQLERLGDELLRSRLEGRLGPEALPEGIRAFAVYGPRGELVAEWGQGVPARIDPADVATGPLATVKQDEGNWVQYVKVLQPLRPRMNVWDEDEPPRAGPPGMGRRSQGFLFVSVSSAPLEGRLWVWSLGGAVGAAVWSGFLVFVGLLWFRTRRYQEALTHHRELLQYAEASRTLSHELQNPLAAILLQTALLKRASAGTLAVEVSIIEEEAQRMSALVSRVRDFLKDPKGQPETVDLAELVESLHDRFAVSYEVHGTDAGHPVRFDRHRLRSVVENLLKNALESGPDPQVEVVFSRPRAGWVRMEVLDRGSGFSAAALKQAKDPFFTTKTSGTGIGLSIAESFVQAAGGKLKLENRPDGGAKVSMDLPEAPWEARP